MSRRVWVIGFSLLCLSLSCFGIAASAQDSPEDPSLEPQSEFVRSDVERISDDRLDQAMRAIQGEESLQRTRPEWEPEAREPRPRRDGDGIHPIARAIASFFSWIGQGLGYLLAAIILIAILAGLYMVFGESLSWRGRQKPAAPALDTSYAPRLQPKPKQAQALLSDAEALAAQGRFAEAVHLLLFRSISDIQEQGQSVIEKSLTAREIGALEDLPKVIRDGLSPIIAIVERSFFGGQSVGEHQWQEARQSYQRFAFGEGAA